MKPYFKYTVPSLLITPIELDVWNKLSSDRPINYEKHINELRNVAFSQLTVLSQKLLKIQNDERENFIKENCDPRLQRLPNIIGLNAIYKNIEDEKSPNCLIITTDAGDVLIMDIQSFNIVHQARVCNFNCTPDLVSAQGSFTNDFRIVISTREATICIIRKNWYEGREIIKLEKSATSLCLLPVDQTIAVVCGDKLMCYSKKGKLLWSVKTKERVLSMTPMSLPYLGISMVCVGLKDGSIQIYSKKSLVDELNVNDPVSAMIFGKLGQEEHVLTMVTQSKIFH
jgi:Bardet-Biedl syndrome 1 protein